MTILQAAAPSAGPAASPALSRQTLFVLGLLALALAAPLAIYPVFLMKALCFALFASAFNLLLGHAGLLSFGHAMFFGWSAYVAAHAVTVWGAGPATALLTGTAAAVALGAAAGWLAIRRQGIYFAMITLALAQLMFFVALQAPMTAGETGIQGVARGRLFGVIDLSGTLTMYYFVLAVFVAGLLFIHRVAHSPFGHVLKAIRDNEARAVSLGYEVDRYKLAAFVISAGLAGLAGGLKALVFQLASLTDVYWHASGEVILMTLIGGVGTIFGPTVGAFIIVGMQNYLAEAGSWVTIIQGAVFVVCVLAFRAGVVGALAPWLKKRGLYG